MLMPHSYDADANAPEDFRLRPRIDDLHQHVQASVLSATRSGPGSTIAVFAAVNGRRTVAAAAGTDAPHTFSKLIEHLRMLV
jgi:hypothetical protein